HYSLAGSSRKRSRSPTTSVPLSLFLPGGLSSVRDDLLPPRKRIRSSKIVTNLEDCLNERSEPYAKINECIAYPDTLRAERIDARVVVEVIAREEVKTNARGLVEDCSIELAGYCDVREDQRMPNIRSGATMTREAVNGLIAHRVAKTLEARDATENLEPLMEGGGEQEDENGDD
ncbi:hypothetical protein Tco_1574561, partial [Tanacetum coccineum]